MPGVRKYWNAAILSHCSCLYFPTGFTMKLIWRTHDHKKTFNIHFPRVTIDWDIIRTDFVFSTKLVPGPSLPSCQIWCISHTFCGPDRSVFQSYPLEVVVAWTSSIANNIRTFPAWFPTSLPNLVWIRPVVVKSILQTHTQNQKCVSRSKQNQ